MIRLLAVLPCLLLLLATAASADLVVRKAYYRDTNLSLHLFVQNKGTAPVTPLPPVVNGFDTGKLGRDGKTPGPVLWYRYWPKSVRAGETSDLTITLAAPPTTPIRVEIPSPSGRPVTRTVPCNPEPLRFRAIRFSGDLRTVYVYLHWTDATQQDGIRTLSMDGSVIAKSRSDNTNGLGYLRIALDKPLVKGSFHLFEATTESGLSTAYQIRAIPAEFIIGTYGTNSPQNIADWAAHGCNHYLSFGAVDREMADLLGSKGLSTGARLIPQHLADRQAGNVLPFDETETRKIVQAFAGSSSLLYQSLVDEPDAGDYYCGRRLGASAMELVARESFLREVDPEHYSFVQLDNTFRPRSYAVYGESADVLATHRYSLGNFIRGEAGADTVTKLSFLEDLQDTVAKLQAATAPKPFFMVTQFFDLGPRREGRPPTIEEMRLQCYAMVAGGARGFIHYIHSGSSGGHEGGKTPALWDAMTAMHQEFARVGDVVQSGTTAPADWVKAASPNVYASGIVSDNAMAVIVINRTHRSETSQFTAHPTRDVKVSVRVPAWIEASELSVVAADTEKPLESILAEGEISFTVDEVRDARCFVLRPRNRHL